MDAKTETENRNVLAMKVLLGQISLDEASKKLVPAELNIFHRRLIRLAASIDYDQSNGVERAGPVRSGRSAQRQSQRLER